MKMFHDVAEHHLAASNIETALLPGRLEISSLLVPLLLQLQRKHLFVLLREKQGKHAFGGAKFQYALAGHEVDQTRIFLRDVSPPNGFAVGSIGQRPPRRARAPIENLAEP